MYSKDRDRDRDRDEEIDTDRDRDRNSNREQEQERERERERDPGLQVSLQQGIGLVADGTADKRMTTRARGHVAGVSADMVSPQIQNLDLRAFDSSIFLSVRGGTPRPIGDFPYMLYSEIPSLRIDHVKL